MPRGSMRMVYSSGCSHYARGLARESGASCISSRARALTWRQVVVSLQSLLDRPLAAGGRTVLEEQGYAYYLSAEPGEVHLYGPVQPPSWLGTLPLDVAFRWHNSLRVFADDAQSEPLPTVTMTTSGGVESLSIRYSRKERAVLELLDELPGRESFEQVDALLEGLSDLSPKLLQALLEACGSLEVKRLFLFFAARHRRAWLEKLDSSRVDLGAGKRVLVNGGARPRLQHHCSPRLRPPVAGGVPRSPPQADGAAHPGRSSRRRRAPLPQHEQASPALGFVLLENVGKSLPNLAHDLSTKIQGSRNYVDNSVK